MKNEIYKIKPIGIVHSSLKTREEVLNSKIDENLGRIEIVKAYEEGLSDVEGFSHIVVIFWMHRSSYSTLTINPIYYPDTTHGVFATMHPDRPNPIGITVVELLERKGNILGIKGVDMIDGTPVVDIKPYTKSYQRIPIRSGWLTNKDCTRHKIE